MTPILDSSFNALTLRMSQMVAWEAVEGQPYNTCDEMVQDFTKTGRIFISTEFADNSIYGDVYTNLCGRAWHDYCHVLTGAEFDAEGERKAAALQVAQMRENVTNTPQQIWFAQILDAEVNGQVEYYMQHGDFPVNGYNFTKERLGL